MKRVFIIAVLFVLAGCGSESPHSYTDTTSLGFRVDIPPSVYEHGLTLWNGTVYNPDDVRATLLDWVNKRVEEWMQSHPELSKQELFDIAYKQTYVLVDHWGFKCSVSDTGACGGFYDYDTRTVYAAIYRTRQTSEPPETYLFNFAPHTVITTDEAARKFNNVSWESKSFGYLSGVIGSDNTGLLSIPHEIDHALLGDFHS